MLRTELKGIAYGMLSIFNSRNNKEISTSIVVIDLLTAQTIPSTVELGAMAKCFQEMLYLLIAKTSFPASWIAKAAIEIDFKPEFNRQVHFFRSALANPYLCTLTIVDDLGKSYVATVGGNCLPHDPSKESKRGH